MKASDRGRNVKFLGNNFGCVLSKLVNNWYRMHCVDNPNLYALSRLHQNRFIAIGCKYEIIDLLSNSYVYVKEAVWRVFAGTVTL